MVGESEDIRLMAPNDAAEVADANRDLIVGIKVRVGRHASGTQGTAPLRHRAPGRRRGRHAADGAYRPPAAVLRGGHRPAAPGRRAHACFRPFPNAPCTAQGKIKPEVRRARERGVLFDIGHGKGSFSFKTARAMLANGFCPGHHLVRRAHAVHQRPGLRPGHHHVEVPVPRHAADEVIERSTVNAAMALKRPELGSLKPGSAGDATVLTVKEGRFDYVDVVGEHLEGTAAHRLRRRGPRMADGGIRLVLRSDGRGEGSRAATVGGASRISSQGEHRCRADQTARRWPRAAGRADARRQLRAVQARRQHDLISGQGPRKPDGTHHSARSAAT